MLAIGFGAILVFVALLIKFRKSIKSCLARRCGGEKEMESKTTGYREVIKESTLERGRDVTPSGSPTTPSSHPVTYIYPQLELSRPNPVSLITLLDKPDDQK